MINVSNVSIRKTAVLLLFLITTFIFAYPSMVFGNEASIEQFSSMDENGIADEIKISGQYIGMYTLEASGIYANKYRITQSLDETIRLSITYEISINITLHIDSETYDYKYELTSFYITGNNIKKSIIRELNMSISQFMNKVFIESSSSINPRIELRIRNVSATLSKLNERGDITGITIFDDVYCYEIKYLYMSNLENMSYMNMVSLYREIITNTPLYYYEITYSRSNFGYIREKVLIINNGLGQYLSNLIVTNSTFFTYGKPEKIGKIGFIGLNISSINILMNVYVKNNTIYMNISSYAPYRVLLLLDSRVDIKYSNIGLTKYNASTVVLYVSKIYDKPLNIIVELTRVPIKIFKEGDQVGLKGLTVEERGILSPSDVVFVILVNIALILIVMEINRIVYRKFKSINYYGG